MLAAAAVAVFITGTREELAMAVFFCGAGVAALVASPAGRPPVWPVMAGLLFVLATLMVFLPVEWFGVPGWRDVFPHSALYTPGQFMAAVPVQALWWSAVAFGTWLAAVVMLTQPLSGRSLAIFLHFVAGVVAAYALVSIVAWQTAWSWPFAEGDVFGLLPNRNHTATLLVVGSIISFGLMQWELTHGHRAGAAFAALCAAPLLAALLFFSISRAGVLLLAAGLLIWMAGAVRRGANRRAVAVSVGVLVLFLGGLFFMGGGTVRDRLAMFWEQALATGAGSAEGVSLDFRQPVFKDTLRMVADAPLTGVGLGHFDPVFRHYRQASLRDVGVLHPESDWLMVVAETGLPSALALIAVVAWFLIRCWRIRGMDDGLLRWTVASAVGAAVLHGIIDVPWHRPALGWFLLVVAFASVPPSGLMPRHPVLLRAGQIFAGLILLAGAACLGWQSTTDRPPLGYRSAAYDAELKKLGEARLHDDGEFVAREAIRDFPLSSRMHLWHLAFLRTFLGSEEEMEEAGNLALYLDPVHPRTAEGVAVAWAGIDSTKGTEAWGEAVRRAARIDRVEGREDLPSAGGVLQRGLESLYGQPGAQELLLARISDEPLLEARWVRYSEAGPVIAWASGKQDLSGFLDGVPEAERGGVLGRLIRAPQTAPAAVDYMEARGSGDKNPHWRALATYYGAAGDAPRAVALVAVAADVPLDSGAYGEFGRELSGLQAGGNSVAVRRLLQEAVRSRPADPEKLKTAMAWHAADGDWAAAWQAASRLASETKIGDK